MYQWSSSRLSSVRSPRMTVAGSGLCTRKVEMWCTSLQKYQSEHIGRFGYKAHTRRPNGAQSWRIISFPGLNTYPEYLDFDSLKTAESSDLRKAGTEESEAVFENFIELPVNRDHHSRKCKNIRLVISSEYTQKKSVGKLLESVRRFWAPFMRTSAPKHDYQADERFRFRSTSDHGMARTTGTQVKVNVAAEPAAQKVSLYSVSQYNCRRSKICQSLRSSTSVMRCDDEVE
ncbi:hypothetical protein EV361DRAFT_381627 [Lentinula raphanica]|uniref:Uncharacterized protein n=1 Tax=Lentinula raphanica TaxID=153919 RepID=A0AA38PK32_9AGAR|nr:hypothetical protein F5878DRAFT_128958 [Lentinula raphanica]KAJ3968950.1 hypothetical protein EV361DRAFT_381627 [Lentinula raphanica]